MLAHLLAIGALDILIAVALAHPQQLVGILEAILGGGLLAVLLPLSTLLLAVEEVHLRLRHRQDPRQLDTAEAELVRYGLQDGTLVGLHLAIGKGGLQLHLQEETQDVALPQAGAAELRQGFAQRKIALLALAERLLGPHPLLAGESHPVHQAGGDPDLVLGDLTARLGDVAHDGEGGVEEDRLLLLAGSSLERPPNAHAPIEAVADPEAEQGAEDVAEQKTEEGAKHLTPNTHGSRPRDVNECRQAAGHPAPAADRLCLCPATRRSAECHRPCLVPSSRAAGVPACGHRKAGGQRPPGDRGRRR